MLGYCTLFSKDLWRKCNASKHVFDDTESLGISLILQSLNVSKCKTGTTIQLMLRLTDLSPIIGLKCYNSIVWKFVA